MMSKLHRLIAPDSLHKTRFHTERGSLMPLSAWATIPSSVWTRMTHRFTVEPLMNRLAVRHLNELVAKTWNVFEFGSGYSTVWLSRRCQSLTSLEHDEDYYDRVKALLAAQRSDNCTLLLRALDQFPAEIAAYPEQSFDLVIVDCAGEGLRLDCIEASVSKVKVGGYLLLDDSDRSKYRLVDSRLAGWEARRMVGWLPSYLHAAETSFYRRR